MVRVSGRVEEGSAQQERASFASGRLAVVVAALLLFVLIVPTASSKLNELWRSEYRISVDSGDPACTPSGYCFSNIGNRLERTASGWQIPLRIEGVGNLYELARELDEGRLRAIVDGVPTGSVSFRPSYELYVNVNEVARRVGAVLEFDHQTVGRLTLSLEHRGTASPRRIIDVDRSEIGAFASALSQAAKPQHVSLVLCLLILLSAFVTCAIEATLSDRTSLGGGAFALFVLIRIVAIYAVRSIAQPLDYLLATGAILIPWLAVLHLPALLWSRRATIRTRVSSAAAAWTASLWRSERTVQPFSILEIGTLALILGVFAAMLWSSASFRWSTFEERDFLEARQAVSTLTFPIYGPELLLGGHTIGSGLYLLLAPVVALWNDPQVLLLFNRGLFLGMAFVLWWGLRPWVGPGGALFAALVLVASERLVGLSYWPIHPNFSLFFVFLYACTVLRGSAGAHRGWLIFSGLLLGFLTQLHFNYFLLVPVHVVLVIFGNEQRDRWTKPLAVAAAFIPLVPFLVIDALQGFPNIQQIALRPRFHSHYPNAPFANIRVLTMILTWPSPIRGPLSDLLLSVILLLIAVGVAVGIGSVTADRRSGRSRMTPAFACAILLCLPMFELTSLGMGYNSRHTLSIVPAIFIAAGFGYAAVLRQVRATQPWIGIVALLPLLVIVGLRAADTTAMARIAQSEGEWAVDYRSREAIAIDLATRVGMSPDEYAKKTIWWWIGWSIDPGIYADIYRRVVPGRTPTPALASDRYVLVTHTPQLPPLWAAAFEEKEVRSVAGVYVRVATPKEKVASALPSSNGDTGVRLHPLLQDIDFVRRRTDGFAHLGHVQLGATRRDLFLGTMAEGRIKLVVTTEQSRVRDRGRLRWCVDSPSLNGHYQEIKTVWRPRLIVTPPGAPSITVSLAADVLGSLLHKTPRCGETWSAAAGPWQVALAADGAFDQSFMKRPLLAPWHGSLDFDAPLEPGVVRQGAVTEWLNTRFGD